MGRTVNFTIREQPQPKKRPRFSKNGHVHSDPEQVAYERRIGYLARQAVGSEWLTGQIAVAVVFHRGTRRRCDIDNLVKLVLDAINGIAFEDDHQVVSLHATKFIGSDDPRTIVSIMEVT